MSKPSFLKLYLLVETVILALQKKPQPQPIKKSVLF